MKGVPMKTIHVKPLPGGWIVDDELSRGPLVFLSGGAAERKARELALLHARYGHQAHVLVHDRVGVVVGSIVVGPG
jgi:hypothetical protein